MLRAGSSKTFNNSGMELHKHLRFGTLVVLLNQLKVFGNDFIWMLDNAVIISENFPHPIEKPLKYTCRYHSFPKATKLHMSILYLLTVSGNYLIGQNYILLRSHGLVLATFSESSSTRTYYRLVIQPCTTSVILVWVGWLSGPPIIGQIFC